MPVRTDTSGQMGASGAAVRPWDSGRPASAGWSRGEGCVAVSAMVWMWVWVGVALWLLAAASVALVIGRVVRSRDNQVPRAHPQAEPVRPEPVTAGERAEGQE